MWLFSYLINEKKSPFYLSTNAQYRQVEEGSCGYPSTPQKNYEQSSYDLFITDLLNSRICLNALSLVVGEEDMDEYFAICFSPLQRAW